MRAVAVVLSVAFLTACGTEGESFAKQFCEMEVSCFPEDWEDQASCEVAFSTDNLDQGAGCQDAALDMLECLAGLDTCQELEDYWNEPTDNYPCSGPESAMSSACG